MKIILRIFKLVVLVSDGHNFAKVNLFCYLYSFTAKKQFSYNASQTTKLFYLNFTDNANTRIIISQAEISEHG